MFQRFVNVIGVWGRVMLIGAAGIMLFGCASKQPAAPAMAASPTIGTSLVQGIRSISSYGEIPRFRCLFLCARMA